MRLRVKFALLWRSLPFLLPLFLVFPAPGAPPESRAGNRFQAERSQAKQARAQGPQVVKIDPPNWWAGLPNPMLLLSGQKLAGASVSAETGARVVRVQAQSAGHYLFVWLDIRKTKPGTVHLTVRTAAGSVVVPFAIERRAASSAHRGFNSDDVIYLIMPDRFADGDPGNNQPPHSSGTYDRSQPMAYHGGDLRGIRQHLAYLHDLGVSTLWLTPIWKNTDSDYHGYHVVDFYAVDDHMGSLQEYQELAGDAHKLGLKVVMDYVVNHTGPKHPWAADPPAASWLHGTASEHLKPNYTFFALTDPHSAERDRRGTLEGWFADKLPDLNPDDPWLAQYLVQNAIWWTETADLDGFRLDTFPYSSRKFWSGWHEGLHSVYPRMTTVGEVWDSDPTITAFFTGGQPRFDGVDSRVSTVFDFPLFNALRDVILGGQPVQKIVDVLRRDWLYSRPDMPVTFLGNHDTRRFMGEDGATPEKLKLAFSLLLTMRGIPQIYAGDEIGMPGGNDPDNRRDFPGGFAGDAHDAFAASGRTAGEQEIFSHVQALLQLRALHPALRHGRQVHIGWDDSCYAFVRETAEEKLLVLFNRAASAHNMVLPADETPLQNAAQLENLFGNANALIDGHSVRVTMPPASVSILAVK